MNKANLIKKLSEKVKIQPRAAQVIVDNLLTAEKEEKVVTIGKLVDSYQNGRFFRANL